MRSSGGGILLHGFLLLVALGVMRGVAAEKIIRVGVVNGLVRGGMWKSMAEALEKETGYTVQTSSGQRDEVTDKLKSGEVDAVVTHTGGSSADLISEGWGTNVNTWAMNEYVLIGPKSDPAQAKGATNTVIALQRIAKTKSHLINSSGPGGREIMSTLLEKVGISSEAGWLLEDESEAIGMVAFAEKKNAYAIVSRSPKLMESLKPSPMEIIIKDDATLRREFIVIEANPAKLKSANAEAAHVLSQFLRSEKFQHNLVTFSTLDGTKRPFLFPVKRSLERR